MPNTINGQGECLAVIPFRILPQDGRTLIQGEGPIVCEFEGKPLGGEGAPMVYHVRVDITASLEGELLPPVEGKPRGFLDAHLIVTGGNTIQYHEGYPPQVPNPCPQASPCTAPAEGSFPLPFEWADGSTVPTPWRFVLRLP